MINGCLFLFTSAINYNILLSERVVNKVCQKAVRIAWARRPSIMNRNVISFFFSFSPNPGAGYGAGDVSDGTRRSRLERMDRDRGDRIDHDYGEEEHEVDYGSASRRRQQQDSRALNAI